jgi:hypothetical protein
MSLFHEGKKLKTRVRLTSHNLPENREFVANSRRFAERNGKGMAPKALKNSQ